MSKRSIKRTVEHQFSQVAANYRTSAVHAHGAEFGAMLAAAGLTGRERVLDAGCGAGHTGLAFAPHVAEVVACDLSCSMLTQVEELAATRSVANVQTRMGDVEQLPFDDGEFDLVVSRYSAHHWPDPRRALQELVRVLAPRPAARVLIADIVSTDDFGVDTFIQTIELLRDPSHVRDHTLSQWHSYFAQAGLTSETVFTWDLRLDFDAWVARMETPTDRVTVIRRLLDGASDEVRAFLRVEEDHTFTFRGAVVGGERAA